MRHTRDYRVGHPVPYFALHRIGFTLPPGLPPGAVGSYPTISPLPRERGGLFSVALAVCTVYPYIPLFQRESCPKVSGLSSLRRSEKRMPVKEESPYQPIRRKSSLEA